MPKRKVINEVREAEGKQTEQELTNAKKIKTNAHRTPATKI
jgi:hypothetical protein